MTIKSLAAYVLITIIFFLSFGHAEKFKPYEQGDDIFLYKTIPGDSLWSIAQRHLHTVKLWVELKKMNELPNDDYIEPGTLISIPKQWLKSTQSTATLGTAIGSVKIINDGHQILEFGIDFTGKDNLVLTTGDVIITGDDGLATIVFKDGSRLLLQSNSELVLKDLLILGDGSLSDIKLQLEKGRLENRVYSSPISNTNYEVKTPTATTSVRGTVFRMGTGNDNSVTEVISGKVVAHAKKNLGKLTELLSGQAMIVSKDGHAQQFEMLAPPEFAHFPQIIETVPIKIPVELSDKVIGYETLIVPIGEDDHHIVSSRRSDSNVLIGDDLPDGRYRLIACAIDEYGVTGHPATYEFILNARPFAAILQSPKSHENILATDIVFKWKEGDDSAQNYYLQVAKDEEFRDLIINEEGLSELTHQVKALPLGTYFWRVASIDGQGSRGPFSKAQVFNVVSAHP